MSTQSYHAGVNVWLYYYPQHGIRLVRHPGKRPDFPLCAVCVLVFAALSNAHAYTVFSTIFPFAWCNLTSSRPSECLKLAHKASSELRDPVLSVLACPPVPHPVDGWCHSYCAPSSSFLLFSVHVCYCYVILFVSLVYGQWISISSSLFRC